MPTTGTNQGAPRSIVTLAAFGVGIPVAIAFLALVHYQLPSDSTVRRYIHHPVECVEVVMFCCAMGALGAKRWQVRRERRACAVEVLARWDGKPVPITASAELLASLDRQPSWVGRSSLGRRVRSVLQFVHDRRSAADLDDQIRAVADTESLGLEQSYALIRFITWAIPILGFLGTVLGITGAISGVTPEVLEKSLSTVTDGLALAFDATALALALTMVTMFITFLTERAEQLVLETVDQYVDHQLAHRFERTGVEAAPFIEAVRSHTSVLVDACDRVVRGQAEVWAAALAETRAQQTTAAAETGRRLSEAIESALERTLKSHASRLEEVEHHSRAASNEAVQQLIALANTVRETAREQQASIAQLSNLLAGQLDVLTQLRDEGGQLIRLQDSLDRNLEALAGAGAFDQAVQSLNAAVHLLTARAAGRPGSRPGAAA